jgi:predicted RNA-binding protein YlxR (DUF448 family)
MIRFVVGPDGVVHADLLARLPGRGFWLSARGDVIETACARGSFARAARGPVSVPLDLSALLQAGLIRRIGELLGLARRAGQAVCGFAKVREWQAADRVGVLVEASDGSAAERERIVGGRPVPVIAPLAAAALGAIFGRERAVHVAVAPGRLADALTIEAERLAGIAGDGGRDQGAPTSVEKKSTNGLMHERRQ